MREIQVPFETKLTLTQEDQLRKVLTIQELDLLLDQTTQGQILMLELDQVQRDLVQQGQR